MAIPLGRPSPDASRDLPERLARRGACPKTRRSYSVLLPVGFALPLPLPPARCALTAPFHPCRQNRRFAFCGTFPGVAPAGCYPAPFLRGARTFLPGPCEPERPPGRLTPAPSRRGGGRRQPPAPFTTREHYRNKVVEQSRRRWDRPGRRDDLAVAWTTSCDTWTNTWIPWPLD